MFATVKTFLTILPYVNTSYGIVAPVGEMSKRSASFSKDVNPIKVTGNDNLSISVFSNKLDTDGTVTNRSVDNTDTSTLSSFVSWYYTQCTTANQTLTESILVAKLKNDIPSITSATFIDPLAAADGKLFFGQVVIKVTISSVERIYYIWCTDASFKANYDEVTCLVTPSFANISQYHGVPSNVITQIGAVNGYEHAKRANDAIKDNPPTQTVAVQYDYVNPTNTANKASVTWLVSYWGNNISTDTFKNAIVEKLLTDTTHTRQQWAAIFPDLFTKNEFLLAPLFNSASVTEATASASRIYKNSLSLKEIETYAKKYYSDVTQAALDEGLHYLPMPYKSIGVLILPGESNRPEYAKFTELYKDIINVVSTSADFNRMSANTQAFLTILNECLIQCEKNTVSTTTKYAYTRVTRNQRQYIVFTYGGVDYLVATSDTVLKVFATP